MAFESLFNLLESLLGHADTLFVGFVEQVDDGGHRFPSHRTSPSQDRIDAIEQGPIPVRLQDALAPFDGVVLAMVWRIVDQHDFQRVVVSKCHHPFHELGPKTGVLGAVVQVNHQLAYVRVPFVVYVPPLLETVRQEVARFP